jgi:hypothetical protein
MNEPRVFGRPLKSLAKGRFSKRKRVTVGTRLAIFAYEGRRRISIFEPSRRWLGPA